MAKTDAKPEWTEKHTEVARQFAEHPEDDAPVLNFDDYMKWLYDVP